MGYLDSHVTALAQGGTVDGGKEQLCVALGVFPGVDELPRAMLHHGTPMTLVNWIGDWFLVRSRMGDYGWVASHCARVTWPTRAAPVPVGGDFGGWTVLRKTSWAVGERLVAARGWEWVDSAE